MSGAVQGLIGSLKSASGVTPTNIITNGSFTVNLNNWVTESNLSRNTVNFRSAPASGFTYTTDEYFAEVTYIQSSGLTAGQAYSFSAWIRNPDTSQVFYIYLQLGSNVYTTSTATLGISTGWQQIKFENKLANGAGMFFNVQGEGGSFYIDDVSLIAGPTALP
jgi:hypothetical protein